MQNALTLWKRTCVISCATARSMQPNTKQRKELLCDCYEKTFQNWITFVNCSSHADTALRTKALDWSTFYNFEILRSVILLLPFFQMFLIYFILPLIHCFYVLFPHFFFSFTVFTLSDAASNAICGANVFSIHFPNHLSNITIIIWKAPAQLQLSAPFHAAMASVCLTWFFHYTIPVALSSCACALCIK